MPQGNDAGVHPDAQRGEGRAGARPSGQAPFLHRLFLTPGQTRGKRGLRRGPRQSLQEFEQSLLGDLAASALHAGEARQPPARAEAQRLGLERPVVGETPACRAKGTLRRRQRRHGLSTGARRRFRHRAARGGGRANHKALVPAGEPSCHSRQRLPEEMLHRTCWTAGRKPRCWSQRRAASIYIQRD